jgi:hypothetical protein
VQGREIDIYMWNCGEALDFGRRSIAINVLRLGWNPKASAPASIAAEIRAHEAATPEATEAQASTTSVTVVVTNPATDRVASLDSAPK